MNIKFIIPMHSDPILFCDGLGFFTNNDSSAKDQSLFVCELNSFHSLCSSLTQPCKCRENAHKLTKTIQVLFCHFNSLETVHIQLCCSLQKGHVLRAEFQCAKCKRRQWWASSRALGGLYLVNQT